MVTAAKLDDDVARSLRELAGRYAQQVGSCASVEQVFGQGEGIRFRPLRPGAAEVGWTDCGDVVTVFTGRNAQLRVDRRPECVERVRLICDAVITGRGCEITGPARTQVSLEFSDGCTARLTAGKGSLKSALRPRYARRVTYLPYE